MDGQIEFQVFDRAEPQLPGAFYRIKKYCFQPKLSHFEILEIQVITVHARILIAISQNLSFFGISKHIFYIFYPIILTLNLVVFGVNQELLFFFEFCLRTRSLIKPGVKRPLQKFCYMDLICFIFDQGKFSSMFKILYHTFMVFIINFELEELVNLSKHQF